MLAVFIDGDDLRIWAERSNIARRNARIGAPMADSAQVAVTLRPPGVLNTMGISAAMPADWRTISALKCEKRMQTIGLLIVWHPLR